MPRVLLLGGTTEASALARLLADGRVPAVFSYAGRTEAPIPQPLPMRTGGFGGVDGLADYLKAEGITQVIDATHPFAAGMSRNAVAACAQAGVPLLAVERRPWAEEPGDRWHHVPDYQGAAALLPPERTSIFLAIGRQNVAAFAGLPHRFLLRFAEFDARQSVPLNASLIVERGPFDYEQELRLLRSHRVRWMVTKNAGGSAARAKIDAARRLQVEVVMIDRPALPPRETVETAAQAMEWLSHHADLGL